MIKNKYTSWLCMKPSWFRLPKLSILFILLLAITQMSIGQTIKSVEPNTIASVNKEVIFTVSGSNLQDGMVVFIENCVGSGPNSTLGELSGGTSTLRRFKGTFQQWSGTKNGVIKDKPGGTELYPFDITTIPEPTITLLKPNTGSFTAGDGEVMQIDWESTNQDHWEMNILKNGVVIGKEVSSSSTDNNTYYNWPILSSVNLDGKTTVLDGNDYKIKIAIWNTDEENTATSAEARSSGNITFNPAVNNTPPNFVSATVSPSEASSGSQFTFNGTWTDSENDAMTVEMEYRRTGTTAWTQILANEISYVPNSNPPKYSATKSITGVTGTYQYQTRARDDEGAWSGWSSGSNFKIIEVPNKAPNAPTLTPLPSNQIITENQQTTIPIRSGTDPDGDQTLIKVYYPNTSNLIYTSHSSVNAQDYSVPINFNQSGYQTVYVKTVDAHGAESVVKNKTYSVNPENTDEKPNVPSFSNIPTSVNLNESFEISVQSGTDPNNNQTWVHIWASNSNHPVSSPFKTTQTTGGYLTQAIAFEFSQEGTQTLNAKTINSNGNESTIVSKNINVTADNSTTNTQAVITSPNSGTFDVGDDVSIQWTSSEQHHYGLYLYKGGISEANQVGTIFHADESTDQSYNWKINPTITHDKTGAIHTIKGNDYKIKIAVWNSAGKAVGDFCTNYLTINSSDNANNIAQASINNIQEGDEKNGSFNIGVQAKDVDKIQVLTVVLTQTGISKNISLINTQNPTQTSYSSSTIEIDPDEYGFTKGPITLAVWIKDANGNDNESELVKKTINWSPETVNTVEPQINKIYTSLNGIGSPILEAIIGEATIIKVDGENLTNEIKIKIEDLGNITARNSTKSMLQYDATFERVGSYDLLLRDDDEIISRHIITVSDNQPKVTWIELPNGDNINNVDNKKATVVHVKGRNLINRINDIQFIFSIDPEKWRSEVINSYREGTNDIIVLEIEANIGEDIPSQANILNVKYKNTDFLFKKSITVRNNIASLLIRPYAGKIDFRLLDNPLTTYPERKYAEITNTGKGDLNIESINKGDLEDFGFIIEYSQVITPDMKISGGYEKIYSQNIPSIIKTGESFEIRIASYLTSFIENKELNFYYNGGQKETITINQTRKEGILVHLRNPKGSDVYKFAEPIDFEYPEDPNIKSLEICDKDGVLVATYNIDANYNYNQKLDFTPIVDENYTYKIKGQLDNGQDLEYSYNKVYTGNPDIYLYCPIATLNRLDYLCEYMTGRITLGDFEGTAALLSGDLKKIVDNVQGFNLTEIKGFLNDNLNVTSNHEIVTTRVGSMLIDLELFLVYFVKADTYATRLYESERDVIKTLCEIIISTNDKANKIKFDESGKVIKEAVGSIKLKMLEKIIDGSIKYGEPLLEKFLTGVVDEKQVKPFAKAIISFLKNIEIEGSVSGRSSFIKPSKGPSFLYKTLLDDIAKLVFRGFAMNTFIDKTQTIPKRIYDTNIRKEISFDNHLDDWLHITKVLSHEFYQPSIFDAYTDAVLDNQILDFQQTAYSYIKTLLPGTPYGEAAKIGEKTIKNIKTVTTMLQVIKFNDDYKLLLLDANKTFYDSYPLNNSLQ